MNNYLSLLADRAEREYTVANPGKEFIKHMNNNHHINIQINIYFNFNLLLLWKCNKYFPPK